MGAVDGRSMTTNNRNMLERINSRSAESSVAGYSGGLGPVILAVCWSMTGVAALFLGTRIYVKLTQHKHLWWDDHLLVASWFMLVAFSSTISYGTTIGVGQHMDNVGASGPLGPGPDMNGLQLVVIIATVFSVVGCAWSKTSFAITLLRLTDGTMYYVIWFVIVSMNAVLIFNAILQFLWCQPASVAWHSGAGGTCWSKGVIIYYSIAAASYSATMDIFLALVPWTIIMKLQMETKEKIGVAVCMSLGIVAAITSIFRAVHIPALYSNDYTFDESGLFIWTAAELATTIIATSIPVLRALLRNIVYSKTRHRTGVNTFKTGTYMCSTVSRSKSYKKMGGDNAKPKGIALASIHENKGSVTSLVITPADSVDKDLEHGGIMKTREIKVDYDRRSQVRNYGDGPSGNERL